MFGSYQYCSGFSALFLRYLAVIDLRAFLSWFLLTCGIPRYLYTVGKMRIEHVTSVIRKYISKGAINMKFSPVRKNPSNLDKEIKP